MAMALSPVMESFRESDNGEAMSREPLLIMMPLPSLKLSVSGQWAFHFHSWTSAMFDTILGLTAAALYQHEVIGARPTSKALLRLKIDSILVDFLLRLSNAPIYLSGDALGMHMEIGLVQLAFVLLTTVSLLFMHDHDNDPDESNFFWKSVFSETEAAIRLAHRIFEIGVKSVAVRVQYVRSQIRSLSSSIP